MDGRKDFQSHNSEDLGSAKENFISKKRKGRGPAMLKNLTKKSDGEHLQVYYNSKGQPIGSTKNSFASYRGLLARTMVAITYKSWHKVPKSLKNNLWTAIQAKFDLNPDTKKGVISDIGVLWKNFKGELNAIYIKPFKDDPNQLKHPPEKYKKFIEQNDWDEFVKVRLSENFQRLSKLQVERRAKNKYNHHLSKKGYAGHVEDLKKKFGESFNEDDRSFVWKTARQNKDGNYRDDATKEVAEKIDALTRQVQDGSLVTQGSSDILTIALGTAERNGRVRGVGKGITPTTYFHLSRHGTKKHIKELESRLRAEEDKVLAEKEKNKEKDQQLQMLMEQLKKFHNESLTSPQLSKASSHKPKSDNRKHEMSKDNEKRRSQMQSSNPISNVGKGKPCRLALDSINNVVAAGFVFEKGGPNDKVHQICLGENNVRVSIDTIYSPNAYLPVPVVNADMITVKNAHGSHVAWPQDFVLSHIEKEKKQDSGDERGAINVFMNMLDTIMRTDAVKIPMGIFRDNLDITYVLKSELLRFCKMEALDISCLIAYMRFLYDKFEGAREVIKFINPVSIRNAFSQKNLHHLITDRLKNADENQIFIFPFNPGYHWVLVVIDYSSMSVFWIDSLHGTPSPEFRLYITTGLKALIVIREERLRPYFESIKGPKQPGNVECGFYVMRYMRDLMEDQSKSLKIKMNELAGKETYGSEEINEIQHEFIEYIQEYI